MVFNQFWMATKFKAKGVNYQITRTYTDDKEWLVNVKNLDTKEFLLKVPYIKVKKYVEKNDKRRKPN